MTYSNVRKTYGLLGWAEFSVAQTDNLVYIC